MTQINDRQLDWRVYADTRCGAVDAASVHPTDVTVLQLSTRKGWWPHSGYSYNLPGQRVWGWGSLNHVQDRELLDWCEDPVDFETAVQLLRRFLPPYPLGDGRGTYLEEVLRQVASAIGVPYDTNQ